jgi:hypothetical protein
MASIYRNRVRRFPEHSERLIQIQLYIPPSLLKDVILGSFNDDDEEDDDDDNNNNNNNNNNNTHRRN